MENTLQELTRKIYNEGVVKAEEEAARIREQAQKEAAGIRQKAQEEAGQLIRDAEVAAEELRKNIQAELKLSANQMISMVKQRITDLVVLKTIEEPVRETFRDQEFLKKLLEMLIRNWPAAGSDPQGLLIMLPAKEQDELEKYLKSRQHQLLQGGLGIRFDPSLSSGFMIGPSDGSYRISFTGEDFASFLKLHLRPRTNKLLYGNE
jgi:V/A-type H+-transporting ATPase subunit E